jgi:hypothetical protein
VTTNDETFSIVKKIIKTLDQEQSQDGCFQKL